MLFLKQHFSFPGLLEASDHGKGMNLERCACPLHQELAALAALRGLPDATTEGRARVQGESRSSELWRKRKRMGMKECSRLGPLCGPWGAGLWGAAPCFPPGASAAMERAWLLLPHQHQVARLCPDL